MDSMLFFFKQYWPTVGDELWSMVRSAFGDAYANPLPLRDFDCFDSEGGEPCPPRRLQSY